MLKSSRSTDDNRNKDKACSSISPHSNKQTKKRRRKHKQKVCNKNEERVEDKKKENGLGNFKMYKRRVGTTDSGRDYEYKMLALLCLRCMLQKPQNMWLVTNADDVGDFDDIVLHIQMNEKPGLTYMLQMKHEDKKSDLSRGDFTHQGKPFNILKHSKGFSVLKETLNATNKSSDAIENLDPDNIVSVFFTNRCVPTPLFDFFENCVGELHSLNTAPDSYVYKINFDKLGVSLENEDYCRNIYFLSNQINAVEIDAHLLREVEKLLKQAGLIKIDGQSIARKFEEYVVEWAKCKLGNTWYLTKEIIAHKLTEFVLDEYLIKLNSKPCTFYECPKKEIWNDFVRDKFVTYIDYDETVLKFLKEYLGSEIRKYNVKIENTWGCNLTNKNKKAFYKKHKNLQTLMFNLVRKDEGLTMLDVYKCLWFDGRIPLVLQINNKDKYENVSRVFEWFNVCLKIIIVNKIKSGLPRTNTEFVTFNDLDANNQRRLLECSVTLQGRDGHVLSELIDKSMYEHLKCKDIIQILSQDYNVGNVYEPTDKYFIERSLYKTMVKLEVLQKIDDIFIIQNIASNDILISKLEALKVAFKLNSGIILEQNLNRLDLEKLKSGSRDVHRFIFNGENWLEWCESFGNTESLKPFLITNSIRHEVPFVDQISQGIRNSVLNKTHIMNGCPGMGKTTLVNFITNEAPPNVFVLKIILNNYDDYYDYVKSKEGALTTAEHVEYFSAEIFSHLSCKNAKLARAVFHKLLQENKVLFLVDGFDEISVSYKKEVTEIAKCLHVRGFHMWITTRPHMSSYLETQFNTVSMDLTPFSLNNQKRFLFNYFNMAVDDPDNNELIIEEFIEKLLETAKKNLNDLHNEFMGIPLQSKLLADVFEDELKTSLEEGIVIFNYKFNLLDLYETFVVKKTKIHCTKHGKCAKEIGVFFNDYQKLFALKIMFHKTYLHSLNIDKQLDDYYSNKAESIEILQREGLLIVSRSYNGTKQIFTANFVHRTFAEFLAAQWLVENYNNKDEKVKTVARILIDTKRFDDISKGYNFLFRIFDGILSKGFPLHTKILNGRIFEAIEEIKLQQDSIVKFDRAKRSILHLTALYGARHAESSKECVEDKMVDIIEAIPVAMIKKIINCDIFDHNPLDYAVGKWTLSVADKICEKSTDININIVADKNNFIFSQICQYGFLMKKLCLYFICFESLENALDGDTNISDYFRKRFFGGGVSLYKNIECYIEQLNVKTVFELFQAIGDKSVADNYFYVLHLAVLYGNIENAKMLLSEGADVNQRYFGHTPLCCAVKRKQNDNLEILQMFGNKADINVTCADGNAALHSTAPTNKVDLANFLLTKGADANTTNNNRQTPLSIALEHKCPEIARLLVAYFSEVNQTDSKGNACLHLAAQGNYLDVTSILVYRGADVNLPNILGETPTLVAIKNKHVDVAKFLLSINTKTDIIDSHGNTYLHEASSQGEDDIVYELVRIGFDVNALNHCGESSLLLALRNKHTTTAKFLLECNAEVDSKDYVGNTCLHLAAKIGDNNIIKRLIGKDMDINARNESGDTLLLNALHHKCIDTANLLLDYNADVNNFEWYGNSYLHVSAKVGDADLVQRFINKGLNVNKPNTSDQTPLHVALQHGNVNIADLLLTNKADVNSVDRYENSCLHFAAKAGHTKLVLHLINIGLDINKLNKANETPLFLALQNRHPDIAKLLLERNAHVDSITRNQNSCLHAAAETDETEIVARLIGEGLDINLQNIRGETPLLIALKNQHVTVSKLLFSKHALGLRTKIGNSHLHYAAIGGCLEEWLNFLSHVRKEHIEDIRVTNDLHETLLHMSLVRYNFRNEVDVQRQIATVSFLISNDVDIDAQDNEGNTALHLLGKYTYADSVTTMAEFSRGVTKLLLDAGVNTSLKNKDRRTALDVGLGNRNTGFVALLRQKSEKLM